METPGKPHANAKRRCRSEYRYTLGGESRSPVSTAIGVNPGDTAKENYCLDIWYWGPLRTQHKHPHAFSCRNHLARRISVRSSDTNFTYHGVLLETLVFLRDPKGTRVFFQVIHGAIDDSTYLRFYGSGIPSLLRQTSSSTLRWLDELPDPRPVGQTSRASFRERRHQGNR